MTYIKKYKRISKYFSIYYILCYVICLAGPILAKISHDGFKYNILIIIGTVLLGVGLLINTFINNMGVIKNLDINSTDGDIEIIRTNRFAIAAFIALIILLSLVAAYFGLLYWAFNS